ncbi:MAG: PAAR domain-containing protein [Chitinivibrionales bacterium]|nr:PAAR domain-containing protein [Chitinivibrionales bacterium]
MSVFIYNPMGKPAARLGDTTAHGGTITGPGCPTVLIGGMPAACMGDMHVCPMVTPGTPPIPHVGGPITLGSTGVLIGGKPAARMGDMAVCVGPPSTIILGCMTVLIGETSGGGGGGGGAGGAGSGGSGTVGALTSAAMAGKAPPTNTQEDHFLDITFLDKSNTPLGGAK